MLYLYMLLGVGCSDVEKNDHDHHDHEHEVMTTVALDFTSSSGEAQTFTWADPMNDGNPQIDDITLSADESYTLTLSFLNELEDPAEDITPEIQDEEDMHQVFFWGSAVVGPSNLDNADAIIEHAYGDTDANGNPVGLSNDITTLAAGSGELIIALRHMPPEDGQDVKVADLAATVSESGIESIGGANDVQVTFALSVE